MSGRALLIGVSDYDADAIPDLDFVPNDLTRLSEAFTPLGYDVTTLGGAGKRSPTHNSLIHEVTEFCRHGIQEDEVAILYFSGHGLHHQGKDYLVPADAQLGDELIEQMMVPVDFAAAYEQSPASAILFFIDACREGIDLGEKALGYRQWGQGKLQAIQNQQSAYVFACGPGEVSRFVPGPDGFSIFTRAFAEVLSEQRSPLPMTFGRVQISVQKRMDELADEFQRKRQGLRVIAESGAGQDKLAAVRIAAGGLRKGSSGPALPSIDIEAIGNLVISGDDLKLFSSDHDGRPPWLEGTIPLTHILRSAAALEKPVTEILERLRPFEQVGIKLPKMNVEAATDLKLSREDLTLLPKATGGDQRQSGSSEVSAIHLIYAAGQLGRPLDEVLDSLRRFEPVGLTLPQIDPTKIKGLTVEKKDLRMLSVDLDGAPPWLQGTVPITHALKISADLQEPLGQVIDRLKRFQPCGIEVSFGLDDHARSMIITEHDLRLLSQNLSGGASWVNSSIPVGHAMLIAGQDELSLREAIHQLKRFEPLGWEVPEVTTEAGGLRVNQEDLVLLSRDFDGAPPWLEGEVAGSRLLAASARFQESVAEVCERIDRFRGAGFKHPELDDSASTLYVTREDMYLVTGSRVELSSWMGDAIPTAHILYAAFQIGEPVENTVARALRMRAAGLEVREVDEVAAKGLEVTENDLLLLSEDLDGIRPWLDPEEVDGFHILRASEAMEEPVGEVAARLAKFKPFGYALPTSGIEEIADLVVTDDDLTVLSRDLDSDVPWIGEEAVSVVHLLRASNQLEKPIGTVLDRLRPFGPLGIEIPEIQSPEVLDLQVQRDDLIILSRDLDAIAPWIEGSIPIGHVLYMAATNGDEVGSVLDRLRRFEPLGFQVPEVDDRGTRLRVTEEDLVLLSRDLNGHSPWVEREIPVIHLLRASHALDEPVSKTLARLQKMEQVDAISLTPFFAEASKSWRRGPQF